MKVAFRSYWSWLLFAAFTACGCCQPTTSAPNENVPVRSATAPASAPNALTTAQRRAVKALADLTEERLALMFDVARTKWNQRLPIENLERERELLDRLVQQGTAAGLSEEIVARFFQNQFQAAKDVQQQYFTRWEQAGVREFDEVPDLNADIRPRIDLYSRQMIEELLKLQSIWSDPAVTREFQKALVERDAVAGFATADSAKIDLTPSIRLALGLHNASESLEH
ncbi:MAG: gamma subclass chorismate mutase AroQ [Planctomycetaceae bacterium]